jgi:uncharacterized RDD family membrane protein YckC
LNPWQILNIEPTDDKKVIKKAYAILIKKYKPDEKPEKFKEIQTAYQAALAQRQWQAEEANDCLDRDRGIDVNEYQDEDFNINEAAPIDETIFNQQLQQKKLIENIYQQLHNMAFASLAEKDKLENWKFVEDNYYKIDDLSIKRSVTQEVFKKVAEYNIFQTKQNKTLLISAAVLNYFNQVFDWKSQGLEYQEIFPDHYFRVTFHYFDNDIKFKGILDSRTGILKRLWAFCIDFLLVYVVVYILTQMDLSVAAMGVIVVSIFILVRLSFELLSRKKSSLGKRYNSMIILDEYGNYCCQRLVLLRHFYASLSLIPLIYMMNIESQSIYIWHYILILIILSLNVYSWVFNKGLLHDMLTKTMVVDVVKN